jgi:hypothetical protein
MSPIDNLPNLDWNEIARQEIIITGANLVSRSDFAYTIGRVAIAGLIYHSYVASPWFWFALAKGVTIRDLIDFRALREEIPHGALTAICEEWPNAVRFAEFYGFVDTGELRIYGRKPYKIFRRT